MEFLEKIPYLLSLFAPIALFFALGLWIAWWLWYRHAARLETAYAASLKLGDQIEKGKREERELSARALALVSGGETKWGLVIGKKDSEFEGLRKRFDKLKIEADGYRNDLGTKSDEVGQLNAKLSNLGEESESKMAGLLGKVSGFEGDLSKRDGDLKKLKMTLDTKDKELDGLRADLKSRSGEIDKLKGDLDGRGAELQTLKSSASGNGEQLQKLKVDLDGRDGELKKLNLSLADRDKELNDLRADLKTRGGEIEKLKADLDGRGSEVQTLKSSLSGNDQQMQKLKVDFGNRDNELKKLSASLATKDKELEGLRADVKARSGEIGKLKTDFDGRGSEIQTLKSSLSGSEQQVQKWKADFGTRDGELKKLEAKLKAGEQELASLRSNLSTKDGELKKVRTDLDQRGKQITTLEATLKTKSSDLDKLRAELQAKQAAAAKLEAQIAEADKKNAGLRNDLSGKESELKNRQAEQANLQKSLDKHQQDSTKQIQGLSSDVTKRNGTIADLEARLKTAKSAVADHEKKIKDTEKDLSAEVAANKKSAAQLQKLEAILGKSNTQVEKLTAELKDRDGNLRTLKSDFGAKDKEAQKLDKEAQGFKTEADKWRAKAQDSSELDKVKNRIKDLDAALAAEKESASRQASGLAMFDGESVSEDKALGFVYKSKPSKVDDLTRVKGVGDVIVKKLHNFGVYRFKQIALWRQDQIDAFSEKLAFKGRIEREIWVNQAADLHFADYKERLRPVVNIYHPPISRVVVKGSDPAVVDAAFEGEDVNRDAKLGLVYKKRPSDIDDLKQISGVAEVLEKKLHNFGIYRFKQVALWQQEQIDEFSQRLNFSDRVYREMWVHQAVDFHFDKYDEHLTPQVEIYRKPKRAVAKKAKPEPVEEAAFAGEKVKTDEKLGLVFTKRPAKVDDLKRIKGIAHVLEDKLHKFGVYRFKQIAMWDSSHIEEFSERLSFRDRVERDNWKGQAAQFDNETNN